MESESKSSNKSSSSSKPPEESKKLREDREKAKSYIKSCKEIVHKQSEQLKKQQSEFKAMLSTLETQHFTARFHAVAFKLELEVFKLFGIMRKVYVTCRNAVSLAKAFHRYSIQTKKSRVSEAFGTHLAVLKARKALTAICSLSKAQYDRAKRTAVVKWLAQRRRYVSPKGKTEKGGEVEQRLAVVNGENEELQGQIARLKAKIATKRPKGEQNLQDLLEENKKLKEKLTVTEQNVGVFIKEMGSLLDQHEPPGMRPDDDDLVPRPPSKNKKLVRPKIRSRMTTYSPERIEEKTATRRSIDKRRLQFD